MDPGLFVAIPLLVFEAVYNAWEISLVNRLRKYKAKLIERHSQLGEGIELVAFILAGILLYFSGFNIILVGIIFVLGIYHLPPTIISKDRMSKMSDSVFKKFPLVIMSMCTLEVVFSIYLIATIIPLV